MGFRLGADIDHVGRAARIEMRKARVGLVWCGEIFR
jgi:hypothetical protein